MLLFRDIKGQTNAVKYLQNSREAERISASYLFSGPSGVGRVLTAKAFIASLMCKEGSGACGKCSSCRRVDAIEHPDITWIRPDKNTIKIEEVRKLKDVLSLKPFESSFNVGVIEDAHLMTRQAQNALLKVLEEPPGKSLLILISDKKEWLLPTVISRCAEVRFRSLQVQEAASIVEQEAEVSAKEAMFLSCLAEGSPGRAIEMTEEGVLERKSALFKMVEDLAREKRPSCMNWDNDTKDILAEDLELLIMMFRDIVLMRSGINDKVLDKELIGTETSRIFEEYSEERILTIVERLVEFKRALAGNVNAKLVAQVLPGMIK